MPEWLKVWWAAFGNFSELSILSVREREEVLGLAPLQVKGDSASFIGSTDVCDYLDFIITPGKERVFFDALLDHLGQQGIKYLEFGLLRPDSTVLASLVNLAENRGCEVSTSPADISLELELPATWENFLSMLKGKQRHEVKRKFRRLYEAGDINFRIAENAKEIAEQMTTFFALFKMSNNAKAAFMNDQMISFFQALAIAMAEAKILKLYILDLKIVILMV